MNEKHRDIVYMSIESRYYFIKVDEEKYYFELFEELKKIL